MIVLVDSSVWIDFFRGKASAPAARLEALFDAEEDVAICGVILTELLQGIGGDAQYRRTRSHLSQLIYLPMEETTHEEAAQLYRAARKRGLTIRNSIDCMIAACALAHRVPLLHDDRDFEQIAKISGLKFA